MLRLLTVFPLSAFLSLFHLVIDNPRHPETQDNLTFLGVAAGYFRRLEYIMKQEFPFSIFPKLAAVAQEFVLRTPASPQHQRPQQPGEGNFDPNLAARRPQSSVPPDENQSLHQDALSDAQTIVVSGPGLSDGGQVASLPEQTTQVYPQTGFTDIDVPLSQMPLGVDDSLYRLEGSQLGQGSEVIDLFGNLLDETYDSLYGPQLDWQ